MSLSEIRRMSDREIEHELSHIGAAFQTCESKAETSHVQRSEKNLLRVKAERQARQRDAVTDGPVDDAPEGREWVKEQRALLIAKLEVEAAR